MEALNICISIILAQVALGFAAPPNAAGYHHLPTCGKTMEENGLTERFPGAVAHGIHSITLEDIRYYFKPNATETNNIPTLNYNTSEQATPVLPHVKLYGYDTSFNTISMRHLDQVLRDMDKKDWGLTNYNTLEKLVHTIHMNDIWARAKVHYDSISLLGYNKELCACVRDSSTNGVTQMLHLMALKIRYPGLTSGKYESGESANHYRFHAHYHFGRHNQWSEKLEKFNFNGNIEDVKERVSKELVDGDEGMEPLTGEKVWNDWKDSMKKMNKHDDYELAVFLYCALT